METPWWSKPLCPVCLTVCACVHVFFNLPFMISRLSAVDTLKDTKGILDSFQLSEFTLPPSLPSTYTHTQIHTHQ